MMTDAMTPVIYRVAKYQEDTHDTFTLELTPDDKGGGFVFRPGQFNMLHLFGVGEVPISISGDPASPLPLRHTIRAIGNVTTVMRGFKKGATLGLRGPFGSHWPVEEVEGKDVIIVAGGIGLAPLRPVIYQILAQRQKYGQVILLYGARTPRDVLFAGELKSWQKKSNLIVCVTVDQADKKWIGNVGVVTAQMPHVSFDSDHAVAFVCGPEIMMHFSVRALKERGLKSEDIYLSMERNMNCAVGFCGHCQYGPYFICKDGPVFRYDRIERIFRMKEI